MRHHKIIIVLMAFLFLSGQAFAETVTLKSGKTITGKILERSDKFIKVEFYGVPVTYYLDEIENISGQESSPLATPRAATPSLKGQAGEGTAEPKDAQGYNERGLAFAQQGNLNQAMIDFTKAIALDKNYAAAYANRAHAYTKQGNLDQALVDYNQAIAINPNLAGVYDGRANVNFEKGNLEAVIADCNQALKLNPESSSTYYNRGLAYARQNNFDAAIADFNQSIRINPNSPASYNNRAIAYFFKKDYDKAWADVQRLQGAGVNVNPEFLAELKKASGRE
jgi:tetratricopeptide (TPR) repeat protein